ncbi:MAG: sigma-70 family RNA polymerase sigma factor [Planctomycetota bacterium]
MTRDFDELLRDDELLRRSARRWNGSESDAEDVLQDVWLAVLQEPEPRRRDLAWMRTLVRNLSVNRFRSEEARRRREGDVARRRRERDGEDGHRAALRVRMLEAVLSLPEPFRRAVLLRHLGDMSPGEIANYTGTPVATVRTQIHRGLERLRERLGVEDPAARRRVRALLFPALLGPRLATVALLILGLGAGLVLATRGGEEPSSSATRVGEDHLPTSARRDPDGGATAALPPRTEEPEPSPPAPVAAATGEEARLVGRLRLPEELGLGEARLRIRAEPVLVGLASTFLDLAALDHLDEPPAEAMAGGGEVTVAAGAPFTLGVPADGQYRIWIEAEGVAGRHHFQLATGQRLDRELPAMSGLELLGEGDGIEVEKVEVCGDGGRSDRPFSRGAGGHVRVEGPLFPRVRVTLRAGECRFEEVVFRSPHRLRRPGPIGRAEIEVCDARSGRPLSGLSARLRTWNAWGVERIWPVVARSDGRLELPVLDEAEDARDDRLEIIDADGARRVVPRVSRMLRAQDPEGPRPRLHLHPRTAREGRLRDAEGSALAGAFVIRIRDGAPVAWGRTDGEGAFRLSAPDRVPWAAARLGPPGIVSVLELGERPGPGTYVLVHPSRGLACVEGAGEVDAEILVWPAASGSREIRVVDEDGAPVSRAELRPSVPENVSAGPLVVRTPVLADAEGRLRFESPAGAWDLLVEAEGFRAWNGPEAGAPDTIVLARAPLDRATTRVTVVDGEGRPLSELRCSLTEVGEGRVEQLRLVTDDRGAIFPELREDRAYRLDLHGTGLRVSLASAAPVRSDEGDRVVVALPLVDVPLAIAGDPTGVELLVAVMETDAAPAASRGRRVVFGDTSAATIPLTPEPQTITLYRPGHRPLVVPVEGAAFAGPLRFEVGPRLSASLPGAGEGATLVLEPVALGRDALHDAPLDAPSVREALTRRCRLVGDRLEGVALMPGRWRVRLESPRGLRLAREIRLDRDLELHPND